MFVAMTLELADGRKARIKFAENPEQGAHVECEKSPRCEHDFSRDHCALLFRAIDVPYHGDALESVRTVLQQRKQDVLFRAIHTSPGFLDQPQFEIVPPWNDDSTKELLELYLTGFTLSMLAGHFFLTKEDIVRQLSAVVYDDHALVKDRRKPRHQKTWAWQEIQFLITQMQVGQSPTNISALMERDSLGIAFKLFDALPVPIPRAAMKRYGISHGRESLELGTLEDEPLQS
jgi:hypothetical protein